MNIIPHIFIPGIIGIVIFAIVFFKYPRWAIAGIIIATPIIAMTWDYYIILEINFLKIYTGIFVILGVIYIIYPVRKRMPEVSNGLQCSIYPIWLIFLGLNFISIFIISTSGLFINKIEYFLRILNGFVVLILFVHLFNFQKDKKLVLSIFIGAGIFPLLLWLIPMLIGNPIISNDPLKRIIGPYNDFWNFMFYGIQTVICCLAYLVITNKHEFNTNNTNKKGLKTNDVTTAVIARSPEDIEGRRSNLFFFLRLPHSLFRLCSPQKISGQARQIRSFAMTKGKLSDNSIKFIKSVVLYFMIIIGIIMVYKCYTKAGWITLSACFFIWFLLRKKVVQTLLVPAIIAVIIFINPFASEFRLVFQNEIDYFIKGSATKTEVFRGRLDRWETGMDDFNELPVVNKLFGGGKNVGYPENDYLRVLWHNGIIGFVVFIILLGLAGYLLIRKYVHPIRNLGQGFSNGVKNKDPVVLVSILTMLMYILFATGFYPMFYPAFQWFMWGMIGFVLSERKGCEKTAQR